MPRPMVGSARELHRLPDPLWAGRSARPAAWRTLALVQHVDHLGPQMVDGGGSMAWPVRELLAVGEGHDEIAPAAAECLSEGSREGIGDERLDERERLRVLGGRRALEAGTDRPFWDRDECHP